MKMKNRNRGFVNGPSPKYFRSRSPTGARLSPPSDSAVSGRSGRLGRLREHEEEQHPRQRGEFHADPVHGLEATAGDAGQRLQSRLSPVDPVRLGCDQILRGGADPGRERGDADDAEIHQRVDQAIAHRVGPLVGVLLHAGVADRLEDGLAHGGDEQGGDDGHYRAARREAGRHDGEQQPAQRAKNQGGEDGAPQPKRLRIVACPEHEQRHQHRED
jgi:hypothetical protein